jgi:hypothetical protein
MAFVETPNMSEPNLELNKQRVNGGGPPQPGAGGQNQEQQPPGKDGDAGEGPRPPAREGGTRDPRGGASKVSRNGGPNPNTVNNPR